MVRPSTGDGVQPMRRDTTSGAWPIEGPYIVNIYVFEIWNIPRNICKISARPERPLRLSGCVSAELGPDRFGPEEAGLRSSLAWY